MYRESHGPLVLSFGTAERAVLAHGSLAPHEQVWRHPLEAINFDPERVQIAAFDDRVVVVSAGLPASIWSSAIVAVVACLELATGHLLWQQRFDTRLPLSVFLPQLAIDTGVVHAWTSLAAARYDLTDGSPAAMF